MNPTIRIDDEVYGALKERAEAFVDTPNDVLRRVLELDDDGREIERAVTTSRTARASVRSQEADRGPGEPGRRRGPAPAGSLLPESEYEIPILESLEEFGGSSPTAAVLDRVGEKLDGRLTELDNEAYGRSGYIRWKNRAQFVRDKLVKKGEMSKDSPRGVWEITDAGRARISKKAGNNR